MVEAFRNIFFTRQKITGAGVYFQGWHRATPIFVDIKDNENENLNLGNCVFLRNLGKWRL